jgi:hypothetical protein
METPPRGVSERDVEVPGLPVGEDQPVVSGITLALVLGVRRVHGQTAQLLLGPAQDLLQAAVDRDPTTIQVTQEHDRRRVIEDRLGPCLPIGQLALDLLEFGEIDDLADEELGRVVRRAHEGHGEAGLDDGPVRAQIALVHLIAASDVVDGLREQRPVDREIRGVGQPAEVARQQVLL